MLQFEIAKKYFKNIAANLVFSAVMMLGFFIRIKIISAEAFSVRESAVLLVCEMLMALFCAAYVAYIMRRFPRRKMKTAGVALIWSLVFFLWDILARFFSLSSDLPEGVIFAVCACVYALLFGVMILSLCACIYDYEASFLRLVFKNTGLFIKMFFGGIAAIVAVCIAAFSPFNTRGGRTTLIIVPKEETAYWEKRIFIAILFFFVPLYALIFIQMSEVMLEK